MTPTQSAKSILQAVAAAGGPSLSALRSPAREEPLVSWRHVTMWLLRTRSMLPLAGIGRLLGRDHGSVIHGVNRVRFAGTTGERRLQWMQHQALAAVQRQGGCWPEWLEDWSI